jgi:membrane fusion protein, multidrug efflux system
MKLRKKTGSRRLAYVLGAAIMLVLAIVLLIYVRGHGNPPPHTAALVPVTGGEARRQNVPDIISQIGTVQSIDSVSAQARVNGPIVKIEFTPGQDVKEGQELFLIDPRPFQAVVDQVQAQLTHDEAVLAEAQVDLTRFQLLAQQNSIAKQQAEDQVYLVEQDKGTVQLDQANLEAARLNLAFCHVDAPITGRAGVLLIDVGNLVGPSAGGSASGTTTSSSTTSTGTANSQTSTGSTMVTIAQMQPIYVTFSIPQSALDQVKQNQAEEPLEVDAYSQSGKLLEKGKLTLIDNQVNTSTGTVLMQATFANADEALWPGEFVRARLIVSTFNNAVTVPAQAVMAGPNGSYIYVINADMTVHRVNVDVIDRQGGIVVIGKGLSGGEKVVVDGQYRLDEGVKVDVQQTTEATSE